MITYGSTYGNPAIHQSAEGFPGSSIAWINMSHFWNRVRHIQDRVYHKPTISAYNSLACHNNGFAPSKQKPNATLQGICPSDSRGCRIHAVGANLVEMAIKMQNSKFCPVYPNWRKKKNMKALSESQMWANTSNKEIWGSFPAKTNQKGIGPTTGRSCTKEENCLLVHHRILGKGRTKNLQSMCM